MNFTVASAFWGLLGLFIPIVIHILSNQKKSIIPFGSLQFLHNEESHSARSIQLSQYLLLASRCILLGMICFFMAQPSYPSNEDSKIYWIEESITQNQDYSSVYQQIIQEQKVKLYTFDSTSSPAVVHFGSAWQLIDHLNHLKDSSVVWSHSLLKHFVGPKVPMAPQIDWQIIPLKELESEATLIKKGTLSTQWQVMSQNDEVRFTTNYSEDNNTSIDSRTLRLTMIDPNQKGTLLKTIIEETATFIPYPIQWVDQIDQYDWAVIISDSLPKKKDNNAIIWQPSDGPIEWTQMYSNTFLLHGQLTQESLLNSHLPLRIAAAFNQDYTNATQYDRRIYNPKQGIMDEYQPTLLASIADNKGISPLWWILVLALIVTERIIAQNQKTA